MPNGATSQNTSAEWAHDKVREIVERSGTSFFWAMRFLPQARRQAIFAVYAFCREVDDIADEDIQTPPEKHAALDIWRKDIAQLYASQVLPERESSNAAVLTILHDAINTYGLEQADFIGVIDGMQMDIDGPIIAPNMDELLLYCDRVASAVGRLCVPIFGQPDAKGRKVADHLGLALQLTNIIRDVPEDAEIDRLYLPSDLLEKHGINTRDPKGVAEHASLPLVCEELGRRAQQAYDDSETAIAACDAKAMRAPIIMMRVYYLNLKRLRKAAWQPQTLRNVSKIKRSAQKLEKLAVALRYGAV